jgi:uncharacterized Ntn-hydrolase superfamily protein
VTFSLAARCARTGAFGVAVSSSSPAVAARCAYVRAGVGAACSQNVTDPRLGPAMLDLLAQGRPTEDTVAEIAKRPQIEWRQLTLVGATGAPAAFTGGRALGHHGSTVGADCVAAGNLLATTDLLAAMVAAFEADPTAELAERLLAAMEAALAAGGEEGPVHSAGMLVATDVPWPVTDLRVDWTDDNPIAELRALWKRWEPQQAAYRARGVDPAASPSYGVPGDDRPVRG